MSNIEVKLDVLNQLASPALYAAALANRPAASFTGRLFVDSDNPSTGIYRDTGSAWIQIADSGVGTSGTLQLVTVNGNTTNQGISVTANGIGIGTTIPASNRLDIHSASGLQATLNGTGVTNAAIQLQLAGTGKWNLSNFYNAAANDFIITDVLNSLNRLTIKNTGQIFVGTDTTSSGLLVVNSATSDNHIVCVGVNGPSVRLRNTASGPTLNVGLGISTAVNNFIQGSVSGDYCIFNSSTTASPILFGVYNSGASQTQEVARISAARNFLVGGIVDAGFKLDITGTTRLQGATQIYTAAPTFLIDASTTTNGSYMQFRNGGNCYIGNDNSTGSLFAGIAYAFNIAAQSNKDVIITTNFTTIKVSGTTQSLVIGSLTDVVSSTLTLVSTTKGFLPPRMTTTQKNAIATPATGLVVYDSILNKLALYTGAAWETVTSI
jgi:hypothetical protein